MNKENDKRTEAFTLKIQILNTLQLCPIDPRYENLNDYTKVLRERLVREYQPK